MRYLSTRVRQRTPERRGRWVLDRPPGQHIVERGTHVVVREQHLLRDHGFAFVDATGVDEHPFAVDDEHVVRGLGAERVADVTTRVDQQRRLRSAATASQLGGLRRIEIVGARAVARQNREPDDAVLGRPLLQSRPNT